MTLTPLAQNNFGDTVPGGLAGPMGLLIIVLLGIATVLLIRNMNSRLRRLPASFDADADAGARDAVRPDAAGPVAGSAGAGGAGTVTDGVRDATGGPAGADPGGPVPPSRDDEK